MKVLYYPKITNEDFNVLMDNFEIQYKSLNNKNRFGMFLALGSAAFSWSLAYSLRMKFSGFVVSTVGTFILAKKMAEIYNSSQMNKSLNTIAHNIAFKYPEIKYSTVEYSSSNDVLPAKLF